MNTLKKISIEIASVVFAVLLALGLNHWREDRNDKVLAEKALQNIIIEIKSNIKNIESDVNEYEVIHDTLTSRKKNIKKGIISDMSFSYNHPILSKSAWQMANTTGAIKDMDIDIMMDLSDLYTFQDIFQKNGFEYFSAFTSLDAQKKENEVAFLDSFIKQLSIMKSWGDGLSMGYREFLIEHEEKLTQVVHPDSLKVDVILLDSLKIE